MLAMLNFKITQLLLVSYVSHQPTLVTIGLITFSLVFIFVYIFTNIYIYIYIQYDTTGSMDLHGRHMAITNCSLL